MRSRVGLRYSGFPTGVNAARVAAEVFDERGLPGGEIEMRAKGAYPSPDPERRTNQ